MTQTELDAIAKGLAPVVVRLIQREIERAVAPLQTRILELEAANGLDAQHVKDTMRSTLQAVS